MKVIAMLVCVLFYFALQDFMIRVVMVFHIRGSRRYVDHKSKRVIRMIFALAKFFADFRIVKETEAGVKLPRQFLLVANHQSLLDIPVLFYCFPEYGLHFVGKKALFRYIILISIVFRVQRHASIDRKGNFGDTMKEIERMGRLIANSNYSPAVFPEGTRSRTGVLGPFRAGAVRTLLKKQSLPVVSVAMEGGYRISRLRQILNSAEGLRYHVKILSVYPPPKGKREIDALLEASRAEILQQLAHWRSHTGPQVTL